MLLGLFQRWEAALVYLVWGHFCCHYIFHRSIQWFYRHSFALPFEPLPLFPLPPLTYTRYAFLSVRIFLLTHLLVSAYAALYFTWSLADLLSFIFFFFSWCFSSIACHVSGVIHSFFSSLQHSQKGFTCFIRDVPHLLLLLIYSVFFSNVLLVYVTQGLEPVPQL